MEPKDRKTGQSLEMKRVTDGATESRTWELIKKSEEESEIENTEQERYDIEVINVLKQELPYAFEEAYDTENGDIYYKTGLSLTVLKNGNLLNYTRGMFPFDGLSEKEIEAFEKWGEISRENIHDPILKSLIYGTESGMYFSKKGIEISYKMRDSHSYNPNNVEKAFSFKDIEGDRKARLLKILVFLNEIAYLEETKYIVGGDNESLSDAESIRDRVRKLKGII